MFVAREQERRVDRLPDEAGISVLTLAELRVGVLLAADPDDQAARLRTFANAQSYDALPVDEAAAEFFAEIVAETRRMGRRLNVIDALIGATARASEIPVYTQDADFEQMPGVEAVLV